MNELILNNLNLVHFVIKKMNIKESNPGISNKRSIPRV